MIKYIWQLPQNLLGLLVRLLFAKKHGFVIIENYFYVYHWHLKGGISLGQYVFVSEVKEKTINHEIGHSRQSVILGPLYLIIVGIPSITMAALSRLLLMLGKRKFAMKYYKRWPESWADKLGKVKQ